MAEFDKFVTLYPLAGGEPLRRHRVDARDLLATGLYQTTPVEAGAEVPVAAPPPPVSRSPLPPTQEPTHEDIGFISDLAMSAINVLRKAGIHTVRQLKATPMEDIEQLELSGKATEILRKVKEG